MRPASVLGVTALLSLAACLPASAPPDASPPPADERAAPSLGQRALDAVIPTAHADQIAGSADRIADVAEATVGAVVHIAAARHARAEIPPQLRMFAPQLPPDGLQRGAGSGVLVDAQGLILTNHHVVDGAEELVVTLSDGRTLDASVVGDDPATDLAVLRIDGDVPADLPALSFGDSDALRLGEVVLAIGSPFELQGTVTLGIVSAKGRSGFRGLASYQGYIQTDAAINPGNSGGALVDLRGELVGINTAIRSQSGGYDGIGFAIPSNLARDILQRLVTDGKVVRGYLGVGIGDVDDAMADMLQLERRRGAVVSHVEPGSAAAKAGLEPYDVIVDVDGDEVVDAEQLRMTVSLKGVGHPVKLGVVREGRRKVVTATLGELPVAAQAGPAASEEAAVGLLEGVTVGDLEAAQAQRLEVPPGTKGALVLGVAPGSDAAVAGLSPGAVVVEVDRSPVRSAAELKRALAGKRRAVLRVLEGSRSVLLTLR
ncbi:MAG: Do family serine endopeptidase [Alphaproteobacteria bacterium]|nr:Do family serine endopeptidase [Alphaproteobacteria bacterium]